MDRELEKLRRRLAQEPRDDSTRRALEQVRLRAATDSEALLRLLRLVLAYHARRIGEPKSDAWIADRVLESPWLCGLGEGGARTLESLRPRLGEAVVPGKPLRGPFVPLDFLDPNASPIRSLRSFLSFAEEFNTIAFCKTWQHRFTALPQARGEEDCDRVARCLIEDPESLAAPYCPSELAVAPSSPMPRGLPRFHCLPDDLTAIFEALLSRAVGPEWLYIDVGVDLGSTFSQVSLLRSGARWYGLEQVFD